MLSLAFSVFALLLSPQAAPAAAPDVPAEAVRWAVPPRPDADDFPAAALQQGVSGQAVVRCVAAPDGTPEFCAILSETPPGLGFGQAAIRIVQRGRLDLAAMEQARLGRPIDIAVPFTVH